MWRLECYLIIPHPVEPRVLLLPGAGGWALPRVSVEVAGTQDEMRLLRPAVGERFGADVTGLRRMYTNVDDQARRADVIQFLENHSHSAQVPAGEWFGREQIADLALARPEQGAFIQEWLAEVAGHPAPVEQFRSSGIACVLRARTDHGDTYFKAAANLPLFGDEPALTRSLSERFPAHIPTILASEPHQRWMLMADFGPNLAQCHDVATAAGALRQFGSIQASCAASVGELLAIGCLDRRLDRLLAQAQALLSDDAALAELDAPEAERLCAIEPRFAEICERLTSYNVPQTLVHGDLHFGNIAAGAETCIFFDWTDACVAHPFFDLVTLLNSAEDFLGSFELAHARLSDDYLAVWAGYEPVERLREACALALPLGALHQAISYQHIFLGIEAAARTEWAGATGYWLRKTLALMPGRSSRMCAA